MAKYVLIIFSAVIILAGCSQQARQQTREAADVIEDDIQQGTENVGNQLEETAQDVEDNLEDRPRTFVISEQNDSGQAGTATIEPDEDGKTRVILSLNGGNFTVAQPAHIHSGTCAEIGEVRFPLSNVVSGQSETVIDIPFTQAVTLMNSGQALAINVHQSAQALNQYTACGDLE